MTESLSEFVHRHIGPKPDDVRTMLDVIGLSSMEELIEQVVPEGIRHSDQLARLGQGLSEAQALREVRHIASLNSVKRSALGQGYYDCHVPSVIQRNVFENPAWYTAYTPYQPEIAQGRLMKPRLRRKLWQWPIVHCEPNGQRYSLLTIAINKPSMSCAPGQSH